MNNLKLNTEDFDFETPSPRHRQRFEKKLNTKKRKIIRPLFLSGLVASFIVMAIFFFNKEDLNVPSNLPSKICYNQELQDIEYYYTSQESQKISEIKNFPIDSSLYQSEVLQLDSMITHLCKELKTAPNDERIIDAAVTHYQMKIKTLDHILKQLKSINQNKKISHEEISL